MPEGAQKIHTKINYPNAFSKTDRRTFKLKFAHNIMTIGKLIQFRRGRHVIHERHFLIEVDDSKSREDAKKYIDKEVSWTSPAGKVIKGKVAAPHGNGGVLRAIFEKGLPGQAITTKVEIKN